MQSVLHPLVNDPNESHSLDRPQKWGRREEEEKRTKIVGGRQRERRRGKMTEKERGGSGRRGGEGKQGGREEK